MDIFISVLDYEVEITLLEFVGGVVIWWVGSSWELVWFYSYKCRVFLVGLRVKKICEVIVIKLYRSGCVEGV